MAWVAIGADGDHSVALKADGTLWMWGLNDSSGVQGVGDFVVTSYLLPHQIGTDTDWLKISAGTNHILALKSDHSLWSWGEQIYRGDLISLPVQVWLDTDWTDINAGDSFSTAIKADGTIWTWGQSSWGRLGLNHKQNKIAPIMVRILPDGAVAK